MTNEDTSSTTVTVPARPGTRKHRSPSPNQPTRKSFIDDTRVNGLPPSIHRSTSKLPTVLSKANTYVSTSDLTQLKRQNTQHREFLNSSSVKFERQATNVNLQARLPVLYSLASDGDHKRTADLRRRQIYALNHLMRELEQEQFQQFCKSHNIGVNNSEQIINADEQTKQEPSGS